MGGVVIAGCAALVATRSGSLALLVGCLAVAGIKLAVWAVGRRLSGPERDPRHLPEALVAADAALWLLAVAMLASALLQVAFGGLVAVVG